MAPSTKKTSKAKSPGTILGYTRGDCGPSCPLHELTVQPESATQALADLDSCIERVRINRGAAICRAKATASFVYCIRSGFVKFIKDPDTLSGGILRIVSRDGIVGLEALFSSQFGQTAIAMANVIACRVPAQMLKRAIEAYPSLQIRLLEHTQRALMDAQNWHIAFKGSTARSRERTAKLLLQLRDGQSDRVHRFSVRDIGALLGITVETASRNLAEMKRERLLDTRRPGPSSSYFLADIEGLKAIAYRKTEEQ